MLLYVLLVSATASVVRRQNVEVEDSGVASLQAEQLAPPGYGYPGPPPAYPGRISQPMDLHSQLRQLVVGNVLAGEALLPQLVPPPGTKYKFKNREKVGLTDLVWQDKNKYKLELDEIKRPGQPDQEIDIDILKTESHTSLTGGHATIHIEDKAGTDLFNLRRTRHTWNPVNVVGRYSFRILCPGCKDNDTPWFTINRDRYFGFTQTWRVYRGRERDGQELYRCEGKWWRGMGAKMTVYRGGTDQKAAKIKQEMNAGFFVEGLPDKFTIEVEEGEDSALMLMLSILIDSATDDQQANDD